MLYTVSLALFLPHAMDNLRCVLSLVIYPFSSVITVSLV